MWKTEEDWLEIEAALKGAAINLVLLAIWAVWTINSLRRAHLNLGR